MEPINEFNNYTKGESDSKNKKKSNREPKDFITKGGITPQPLDKMFSNEEGYEIEIKEDKNDLYFDVVDEQSNKRYLSKIRIKIKIAQRSLRTKKFIRKKNLIA